MTLRGPWAVSLGLHLALVVVLVGLASLVTVEPPAVVRMRLVAPQVAAGAPSAAPSRWWRGPQAEVPAAEVPTPPDWQAPGVSSPRAVAEPTVPFQLDELLAGVAPAEVSPVGWALDGPSGSGYALPPLPPPHLAPRQGARWVLTLTIPGIGGFATVEGLDSGHPALDHWLEAYLRTVVFPPSLDGSDYQLRWNLRLDSGRPE